MTVWQTVVNALRDSTRERTAPLINLLKQHAQMQKMMKKMGQGGLRRLMRGFPGLAP